tara:strand:- start:15 stop:368 length:354 start_codon:yes stop_codon:yes gene_type:complete
MRLTDEQSIAHKEAFDLMDSKGMTLGEKLKVRSKIIEWSGLKDEHPFISSSANDIDGEEIIYQSTHELISSFVFQKREEVVLANAIYLNMNEIHGDRELIEFFKFTCKIIGITNAWT